MANPNAIQTLIELSVREVDEHAKRLGLAMRAQTEQEEKLALLQQYRNDYEDRCQASLSTGLSTTEYQNYRVFLNKLEDAIAGQQEVIKIAIHKVAFEKLNWQTAERKRMSYDALAKRGQLQAQQQATKRDQKETDEYANRAFANKIHQANRT
jgi:flagellar FliJ protein